MSNLATTYTADMEYEVFLEHNIDVLTATNAYLNSLLDSFWTGDLPEDVTLDHMVLAKAGRHRLEEKAKVCALLGGVNLTDQSS